MREKVILYFLVPRVLQNINEMERKFAWRIRYLTLYSGSYVKRHLVRKEYLMLAFRSLRPVSTAVLYAHVNSTKSLDSRNTPIQISSQAFPPFQVRICPFDSRRCVSDGYCCQWQNSQIQATYYELSSFFQKDASSQRNTYILQHKISLIHWITGWDFLHTIECKKSFSVSEWFSRNDKGNNVLQTRWKLNIIIQPPFE